MEAVQKSHEPPNFMIFNSLNNTLSTLSLKKLAGLILACLLSMFVAIPEAAAQCGTAGVADVFVSYEGCAEAKSGGTNITSLSPAVPVGTASGDLLITSISVDGSHTIVAPAGWTTIENNLVGAGAVTLGVFFRVAGAGEPANYTFSWTGNERAISIMMRFTNATGNLISANNSGATGAPQAPTIDTNGNATAANNLILRLAAWDDDDEANNPAVIIPGHININQDQASGGAASSSGSAAFVQQPIAGFSGTADFAIGNEQWATVTVAIEPGPAVALPFFCPGIDGSVVAGQLVVLQQCTEFKGGTNAAPINIDKPSLAVEGDLLLAVIHTDGNELPFNIAPTADGFTLLRQDEGQGVTFAIYAKFVSSTEPASYAWNLANNEQRIAYILLFTGASGKVIPNPVIPFNEAISASPLSPGIVTTIANTLVLRMAVSDDDDVSINLNPTIPGGAPEFNNIISTSSSEAGRAVSSQAVYRNAAAPGAQGTAAFAINSAN